MLCTNVQCSTLKTSILLFLQEPFPGPDIRMKAFKITKCPTDLALDSDIIVSLCVNEVVRNGVNCLQVWPELIYGLSSMVEPFGVLHDAASIIPGFALRPRAELFNRFVVTP